MTIVPSNAGKKQKQNTHSDAVEAARDRLNDVLAPFFYGRGAEARRAKAVDAATAAIAGLITMREVSGQNLGATIMTEAASIRNPVTGDFNKAPRNI